MLLKGSHNSGTQAFSILLKIQLRVRGLWVFNLFVSLRIGARERTKKLLVYICLSTFSVNFFTEFSVLSD